MAAVNNLVTGGIGPASEIKYVITGGLDIGASVVVTSSPGTATLSNRGASVTLSNRP